MTLPIVSIVIGMALVVGATSPATGQTIKPLVSEYGERARGRVELANGSEWPLDVVLQSRGFTINREGDLQEQPLPPGISIKLSAMSVRIPPGQSRMIFYEATADRAPAWFVFFAVFSGFPANETGGVSVQVELPHIVYMLPKTRLKEGDLRARLVEFSPGERRAVLEIENVGRNFGRILNTKVESRTTAADSLTFPLLPGGVRRLVVPWNSNEPPEKVILKGRGFSLAARVTRPATASTP